MSEMYSNERKPSPLPILALVFGLMSFLVNPFWLVSIAAIVLGIIGMCQENGSKGMALAGILTGVGGIVVHVILDSVLSFISGGIGFCSYFI